MKLLNYIIVALTLNLIALGMPVNASEDGLKESVFRIGIFPRRDPLVTIRMYKPLQAYLQAELGMPVELETAASFQRFEANLQTKNFDLIHFNQCHYIEAHEEHNYQVIVQNEELGEPTIRGAIFVRKDSGITSLEELKGRTLVFGGGEKAMISYVVPRYLLQQANVMPGDYQERFAKSPPNAVLAVFQKQAIAAGAGEIVKRLPLVTGKVDASQLVPIAQSEPLSHLPWAVRGEMSEELKNKVRELLIGLKDSEKGREILKAARLTALNPAVDQDYDRHRAIINSLDNQQPGTSQ